MTAYGHPLASLVLTADVRLLDPATGAPDEDISAEAFGRFAVDGYGRMLGASGVRASIGTTASSLSLRLSLPGDDRLPAEAAPRPGASALPALREALAPVASHEGRRLPVHADPVPRADGLTAASEDRHP